MPLVSYQHRTWRSFDRSLRRTRSGSPREPTLCRDGSMSSPTESVPGRGATAVTRGGVSTATVVSARARRTGNYRVGERRCPSHCRPTLAVHPAVFRRRRCDHDNVVDSPAPVCLFERGSLSTRFFVSSINARMRYRLQVDFGLGFPLIARTDSADCHGRMVGVAIRNPIPLGVGGIHAVLGAPIVAVDDSITGCCVLVAVEYSRRPGATARGWPLREGYFQLSVQL